MQVAVVTPYHREPDAWLDACCTSVAEQRVDAPAPLHYMVGDGVDNPYLEGRALIDAQLIHVPLHTGHRDYGNTPRAIGSLMAATRGVDAIAFLDADNWFRPDHLARMLELHRRTGAAVCTAGRTVHHIDGRKLYIDDESDGVNHIDTSCFVLFRPAFALISAWLAMPRELAGIGDRFFLQAMRLHSLTHAHDPAPSVAYRTNRATHYNYIGATPPADAKPIDEVKDPMDWWQAQPEDIRDMWVNRLKPR
jgi:hypothetical protein